jgi:hypothetical protein
MRPSITFVIAVLITFGGTGAALSNCPKNLSAAGDVFRLQAHGLIGDQLDPVSDFGESSSLDPYATSFEDPSSCAVGLDTNSFTLVGATKIAGMVGTYNRATTDDPIASNFCDMNIGLTGLDPLSQQFANYNGDLINPYTNSTGDTAFSGPTNSTERYKHHRSGPTFRHGIGPGSREHNVALNEWATSMMLSYRSPALPGWPTYDVPMMVGWMGTPVKVSDYPAGLKNLFLSARLRTFNCR